MNEESAPSQTAEEELPPTELDAPEAEDPMLRELSALRAELSELRAELTQRQKAEEINRRNAALSAGRAGTSTAPEYYSPEEVRAMSAREVRENYQKIRASMKRWH